jgi:branched-chain amino acid transport system permease protein
VLAMVVLGGRISVWGALTGAVILTVLPELFRAFEDYRMVVLGALLMLCIIYLPKGVADTLIARFRQRRIGRATASLESKASA